MRRKQNRLAVESLEDRRLLAQTPELLFDVVFDMSSSERGNTLSEVHEVDGLYLAWLDKWDSNVRQFGTYEVVNPQSGTRWTVEDLPRQRPEAIVPFNDSLYLFYAQDYSNRDDLVGQEIWKTDGRVAEQVSDIAETGFTIWWATPPEFDAFVFRDRIYFPADDEFDEGFVNYAIWESDGTQAGTVQTEIRTRIEEAFVFKDKLYFVASQGEVSKLYVAVDTIENAQELTGFTIPEPEFRSGSGPEPRLMAFDDQLYFYVSTENEQQELWSTDGESPPMATTLPNEEIRAAMPGEILYDTPELLVSATYRYEEDISCAFTVLGCPSGALESWFHVDLWMSHGEGQPQFLTTVVDRAVDAHDGQLLDMSIQQLEDRVIFRMLTTRSIGNYSRSSAHFVDLPSGEAAASVPGDADSNGSVDFADFLIVSSNFEQVVDALWSEGDFNGDGSVNFADFLLLADNFVPQP